MKNVESNSDFPIFIFLNVEKICIHSAVWCLSTGMKCENVICYQKGQHNDK